MAPRCMCGWLIEPQMNANERRSIRVHPRQFAALTNFIQSRLCFLDHRFDFREVVER